jgi:hypothetical protein
MIDTEESSVMRLQELWNVFANHRRSGATRFDRRNYGTESEIGSGVTALDEAFESNAQLRVDAQPLRIAISRTLYALGDGVRQC